jgi:general secretion pathway protein D
MSKKNQFVAVILFTLFSILFSASAQEQKKVRVNFQDELIDKVAIFISEVTDRGFIVGAGVSGRISLVLPRPVSPEEAYRAFLSALKMKNYSYTERNGITTIGSN